MRSRGELFVGGLLVAIGLIYLIGNVLNVNFWAFFWPLLLIALGAWFILREQMAGSDTEVQMKLLGDVHRDGPWQVKDEEIWLVVGDVRLDLMSAEIPPGETTLSLYGFVGDVKVVVPQDVGLRISSRAFVSDAKIMGGKEDSFLAPVHYVSDDYDTAERKIRLTMTYFVADLTVRQG